MGLVYEGWVIRVSD